MAGGHERRVRLTNGDGVYELVPLPESAAALSGKWVLKIKRGAQGEIERFKARYVVRGFEQVLGKDFH